MSASASENLFWKDFLRSRMLWRFCPSFSVCITFESRSFSPLDADSSTLATILRSATSFVLENDEPKFNKVGTDAGCCLLLNVEEDENPVRRRHSPGWSCFFWTEGWSACGPPPTPVSALLTMMSRLRQSCTFRRRPRQQTKHGSKQLQDCRG